MLDSFKMFCCYDMITYKIESFIVQLGNTVKPQEYCNMTLVSVCTHRSIAIGQP